MREARAAVKHTWVPKVATAHGHMSAARVLSLIALVPRLGVTPHPVLSTLGYAVHTCKLCHTLPHSLAAPLTRYMTKAKPSVMADSCNRMRSESPPLD